MNKSFSRAAAALAIAACATGTVQAAVFGDFTVDQTSITVGNTPLLLSLSVGQPTFVADKINGGYNEILTISAGLDPTNNPFTSNAYAFMNGFFKDEGTNPAIGSLSGTAYNLYATFTATGSYNLTNNTFTGASGVLNFYLDPLVNTTIALGPTGSSPLTVSGGADDYLLATATNLIFATGNNVQPGSYQIIWDDLTLSAAGSGFFVAPDPFYLVVNVTGDFDQFPVNFDPATNQATIRTTGDVSAVFDVPEPTSLALIGLSLLGLAATRRRKA
ncbi:flocculation-associated PEP-CTERM protein PepA [Azohydromonas sediminis]|uniref:flocculation-associated PEP-CTERM protein PepA n=1 Tax=Azohydromonas sediminis TaxID=2259674 RepID=UPI0013C308B7|nr:flocculation-associated PEP-CTERM protein PepA [Azohydromonas sediminis]